MKGNTTGKIPDGLIPFFDQYPKSGNCEFKQFGEVLGIKELGNAIFCLLDVVLGLFGVITFRNINLLPEYMFGLVAGYGIANAVYSARLWYGCAKINSLIVNVQQTLLIYMLYQHALQLHCFSAKWKLFLKIAINTTAGLYPFLAFIISLSFSSKWVDWLTFDLLWPLVIPPSFIIYCYRKHYTLYSMCPSIFKCAPLGCLCVVLA